MAAPTLLSATITGAVTGTTTTAVELEENINTIFLQSVFTYGSGGTTAKFWVQTSYDNSNWIDIACFAFTTASAKKVAKLGDVTAVSTVYTPTDATMADDTTKDGLLGKYVRVKYTTTGTYAGDTTIAIRMFPRAPGRE